MKLRIIDTAGVDDFEESNDYDEIVNKTIQQTRQALVHSDLALFLLDSRQGITPTDVQLARWLNYLKYRKDNPEKINFDNISSSDEFYKKLKTLKEEEDVQLLSKVLLIANKVENNFIPSEIFSDFNKLKLGEPILISAEQGDNLHELYNLIEENIPMVKRDDYEDKMKKRLARYKQYRESIREDFINNIMELPYEERKKYSIKDWEKDFDYLNKFDLEDNSDYDSDNDIDPLDTIIDVPNDQILRENLRMTSGSSSANLRNTNNIITQDGDMASSRSTSKLANRINQLKQLKRPIKISLIGRQNVGKSSIINSLLKDNRVIVSDIPGTTRDTVPIEWIYKGRRITLTDTAGLKPKNKAHDKIEKMATSSTIKAIKDSHVIIYVIDSLNAFTQMDMKLIEYIGKEGRSLVVLANKWDLVENGFKTKAKNWMENQLEKGCSEYSNSKISYVSAKNFFKIDGIMDDVLNAYSSWNKRIPTNLLNQWVNEIKKVTHTPNKHGEHLRLKFMTQIKTRPPCFSLFVNNIHVFLNSHDKFLKKMMVKEFDLIHAPIRFLLRDHKVVNESDEFKKMSVSTAKIKKKVDLFKKKMANPTYRRKSAGYDRLYGRGSEYRNMKK